MHACVYACVYVCGLGSSEAGRFAPTHSLWVLHVKGFESRCFRRAQAVGCNRFYSALSNVKLCRCSRMFYPLSLYAVFKFFLYPPFYHPPPPPPPPTTLRKCRLKLVAIKELLGKVKAWVAEAAVVEVSVEFSALVTRALHPPYSLTHGPWCIVLCRDKDMWTVCNSCWTALMRLVWT